MTTLVLKGHATRGKEVINLLEMLGANRLGYKDTFVGFYYYIECGAICSSDEYPTYSTIFTLEEFEEKYPYKVGDKVLSYNKWVGVIESMEWYRGEVLYHVRERNNCLSSETVEHLQYYIDMSDLKKCGTATIKYIQEICNMEQKINIAEILKNCPKGMELDCALYDNVTLISVDDKEHTIFPIKVRLSDGCKITLTEYGQYAHMDDAKCIIFPKGKTTWEGFVPPFSFKDGDVLVHTQNGRFIMSIYKSNENEKLINTHVIFWDREEGLSVGMQICCYTDNVRFATKEEKAKLFDAIKDNGYKWNEETKTLEKLSEPKFKVGDRIKHKTYISQGAVVTEIKDTYYIINDESALPFTFQDEYDLVPNKFDISTLKPFESRVLVRNDKFSNWKPAIFGCYMKDGSDSYYSVLGGTCWIYCIPYESNEHLLGTTNDCDEFYKNWKELCHSKVKNCR